MIDVAKRLEIIEARIAISELRSKYCWYTTRGLKEELLSLFTDDGIFQNSRSTAGAPHVVKGTAALSEYFSRMRPARRVPLVMNEVTHVTGDFAEGTCAMQAVGEESFCGHYIDDFRRVNSKWLFAVRRFYPYWPTYMPDPERRHP